MKPPRATNKSRAKAVEPKPKEVPEGALNRITLVSQDVQPLGPGPLAAFPDELLLLLQQAGVQMLMAPELSSITLTSHRGKITLDAVVLSPVRVTGELQS